MVTSHSHTSPSAQLTFPLYFLAGVLLLSGGALGYVFTSFLTQLPLLSLIGIWLFGPAFALIALSYLLSFLIEEAQWMLLLGGQAVGGVGILLLIFGLF